MIINGREVRNMSELTDKDREALPEGHPWKHKDSFTYRGVSFTMPTEEDEADTQRILDEQEAERKAASEKARLEYYRNETKSGVSRRYWDESLDTYIPQNDEERKNLEVIRKFAKQSRGGTLVLCGENGTGKTLLGSALVREKGGKYITMTRLLFEVDSTMSFKASRTKIEYLDELANEPLLVIDELGKGLREDAIKELIFFLYNERYNKMLDTVFIGNFDKEVFFEIVGRATIDRMNENCVFLEFNGESYRKKKREANIARNRKPA